MRLSQCSLRLCGNIPYPLLMLSGFYFKIFLSTG